MSVFNIKIKKNNFSKSLILKIDPITKNPILTVPIRCTKKEINSFLSKSKDWIEKKLSEITKEKPTKINILDEEFSIFESEQNYLDTKNRHIYTSNYKIMHLFKEFAKDIFKQECDFFSNKLNVSFKNLVINDSKRVLGSYRPLKSTITLSVRLLLATKEAMSYVCAHEISHILHPNHKKEFHSTLESLIPNHRTQEKWLRLNSKRIFSVE